MAEQAFRGSGNRKSRPKDEVPPERLMLGSVLIIAALGSGLFYSQKMEATIADVV